ncbi:MAG TPA: TetR/AcrR family transcriptional regulator [Syntrophales bacterium]|nr:TetR/AcrR family transcriptional regulator [Syntrophales bacterium]
MGAEHTRDRILEASLKLFSQKGFLGATTREIAREAGVAEVTLFRHFPSKKVLFEEVIRRYSFLPALKELLPELEHAGYEETLLEIARRFLEKLGERKDLIRIMLAERHLYPSRVKRIFRDFIGEMIRMLADYFRQLQVRGILRDFDPDAGAKAFLGSLFAYVNFLGFFLGTAGRGRRADRFSEEFVKLFIEGTVVNRSANGHHRKRQPLKRGGSRPDKQNPSNRLAI